MYRVEARFPDTAKAPEPREFRTAAELLHWAIKEGCFESRGGRGRPKRPDDVYIGAKRSPGHDYHLFDSFCRYRFTPDLVDAMYRAWSRYREIVHYLREVEPQWVEGPEFHYMDNSIEREDTNKYGQTRRVTIKQPSGDACF